MNSKMKLVNFRCPEPLLEVFDEVTNGVYKDRTSALLDGMRKVIREVEEQKRVAIVATKEA